MNGPVTEPKDKANELNKFFSEIGPNLANRIDENDFCDYKKINNNKGPTFNLVHVDYDYVFNQLTKLSNDKATGLDNIPSKLLKLAAPVIAPIITHLINHSFTTCKFPSCWKRAKVIPVFKAGDHCDPSNYRPISILVVISKIAERAVFDQLYNYLNDNGLINIKQSGFRPIHSTSSALINITEDWYDEIDKGNLIGLCMLDLKKAFDTVNHEIFLDKLKLYRISKYCIQWFRSYLTGCSQCTTVDGILSDTCEITCGMPQGSIDGPFAFLIIYINDLPNYVTHTVKLICMLMIL